MFTVKYWVGTTQYEAQAKTAAGVARICERNQNAFGPTIYDEYGKQLHLTYETLSSGRTIPVLWDEDGNPV